MNYYEHHLGDYLRDTAHLSMLEDGAYRRLLDAYYIKELPLPKAMRDVCRLVRAISKPERDAVAIVLSEFFEESGDSWNHKRCDEEIARYKDKQAKAKRSAEVRWGASKPHSEGNANASTNECANAMRTHSEGNALQSPVTSNHSSSLRSEDSAAKTQRSPSRPKREEVTLAKYLENCKANGVKPVPDDHFIRAWCVDAKIPTDMLQVAWVVFREKYLGDEKLKGKRYKDWAGHFATAVKDRWHGLWFIGEDGTPAWTSTGLQRKQVLDAQHKNQSGGDA